PVRGVANSGSALANGFGSGAHVLVSPPFGGPPAIWAPAFMLGLDLMGPGTDDLDGLVLWENGTGVFGAPGPPSSWGGGAEDMSFFSARRGSAVIGIPASGPGPCAGMPISPGDILWPPMAPGMPPRIWINAERFGLATTRAGFPVNDDMGDFD